MSDKTKLFNREDLLRAMLGGAKQRFSVNFQTYSDAMHFRMACYQLRKKLEKAKGSSIPELNFSIRNVYSVSINEDEDYYVLEFYPRGESNSDILSQLDRQNIQADPELLEGLLEDPIEEELDEDFEDFLKRIEKEA